jgi:hypothetical protein
MHHKVQKLLIIFFVLSLVVYILSSLGSHHYNKKMSLLDSLHYSGSIASLAGYSKVESRSSIAKLVDILAVFAGVWAVVV